MGLGALGTWGVVRTPWVHALPPPHRVPLWVGAAGPSPVGRRMRRASAALTPTTSSWGSHGARPSENTQLGGKRELKPTAREGQWQRRATPCPAVLMLTHRGAATPSAVGFLVTHCAPPSREQRPQTHTWDEETARPVPAALEDRSGPRGARFRRCVQGPHPEGQPGPSVGACRAC